MELTAQQISNFKTKLIINPKKLLKNCIYSFAQPKLKKIKTNLRKILIKTIYYLDIPTISPLYYFHKKTISFFTFVLILVNSMLIQKKFSINYFFMRKYQFQ